jgi:hypothetical protein
MKNQSLYRQGAAMREPTELDDRSHIESFPEEIETETVYPVCKPEAPTLETTDMAEDGKCPIVDGHFSADFSLYLHCDGCRLKTECKQNHDREARRLKEEKKTIPLYIKISKGLMIPELDSVERIIISVIYYRQGGVAEKVSYDKNVNFAKITGASEPTISRKLGNGQNSLVSRGYVKSWCETQRKGSRQPKKGEPIEYHTTRKLSLTPKALRLINRYKEVKDGLHIPYEQQRRNQKM